MIAFFRCRLLTILACAAMTQIPQFARGQDKAPRDGAGIVWFIGSVLDTSDGQMAIDLGDAHALVDGDDVAVFRLRDNQFRPLGTIQIQQSRATWSMPKVTIKFELEPGDRVVYVKTLAQLGAGDSFRDGFIRQQIVKRGLRNHYSTVNELEEAAVLERYRYRQPRWEMDQKHIAGAIRSASVSRTEIEEMQPLLTQVLKFQGYQTLGVPIEPTIGAAWQSVLTTLTPVTPEVFDSVERAANAAEAQKLAATTPSTGDASEKLTKIASIRRHVEELLFQRSPEERNVVTILCAALEVTQPRNERQWYSLQLRSTQFASLSEERLLLDEIETVMRRVREEN